MIGTIYAHINRANEKIYVGQTFYLRSRWYPNSYRACPRFSRALAKYGWDGFDHVILAQKEMAKVEMDALEELWIAILNTTDKRLGYNIAVGGGGSFGYTRPPISEETREKMAAAGRGRKHSEESKSKISAANKGVPKSVEHKAHVSAGKMGIKLGPFSPEHKENMRLSRYMAGKRYGASKYKGVHRNKGKWRATIRIKSKRLHLGYFTDEILAAKAYDEAAKKHFGDRVLLNFPM